MGREAEQPQPCPAGGVGSVVVGKVPQEIRTQNLSGAGGEYYPAFQLDWDCQREQTPLWQVEPGVSLSQGTMQPHWAVLCRSHGSCSVSPGRIAVPGLIFVVDFWTKRQKAFRTVGLWHSVWQGGSPWCPRGPGFVVSWLVVPSTGSREGAECSSEQEIPQAHPGPQRALPLSSWVKAVLFFQMPQHL